MVTSYGENAQLLRAHPRERETERETVVTQEVAGRRWECLAGEIDWKSVVAIAGEVNLTIHIAL